VIEMSRKSGPPPGEPAESERLRDGSSLADHPSMTWQRRLIELAVAGGTLAGCAQNNPNPIPCGNANPDPCICGRTPDPEHSPQCIAEDACTNASHQWNLDLPNATTDAGVQLEGHCDTTTD
jgi:hypothetical protein